MAGRVRATFPKATASVQSGIIVGKWPRGKARHLKERIRRPYRAVRCFRLVGEPEDGFRFSGWLLNRFAGYSGVAGLTHIGFGSRCPPCPASASWIAGMQAEGVQN